MQKIKEKNIKCKKKEKKKRIKKQKVTYFIIKYQKIC